MGLYGSSWHWRRRQAQQSGMSPLEWRQQLFFPATALAYLYHLQLLHRGRKKTSLQSAKFSALHSCTVSSFTALGIGVDCFQVTARTYGFPADLDEAPSAWI